jgi:ribonuclease P protein component
VAPPGRLADSRVIAEVLGSGRRRQGRLLTVAARDRGSGPARVAVVASRRVGTAVRRNRAKRLLREAAARVSWRDGRDVVLVAKAECARVRMGDVHRELARLARGLEVADD